MRRSLAAAALAVLLCPDGAGASVVKTVVSPAQSGLGLPAQAGSSLRAAPLSPGAMGTPLRSVSLEGSLPGTLIPRVHAAPASVAAVRGSALRIPLRTQAPAAERRTVRPSVLPARFSSRRGSRSPLRAPRARVRAALNSVSDRAAPELEAAASPGSVGVESSSSLGRRIQDILMGRASGRGQAAVLGAPSGSRFPGLRPASAAGPYEHQAWSGWFRGGGTVPSPASFYRRALDLAVREAAKTGEVPEDDVRFGEASISLPVKDNASWRFTFYLARKADQKTATAIRVEFIEPSWYGRYRTRVSVQEDASAPAGLSVFRVSPAEFGNLAPVEGRRALALARMSLRGGSLSVSLRLEAEKEDEPEELWYHFFDEYGSEVAVHARDARVRTIRMVEHKTKDERLEQWRRFKKLRDLDDWLGARIPLYDLLKWLAIIGICVFLLDMALDFTAILFP